MKIISIGTIIIFVKAMFKMTPTDQRVLRTGDVAPKFSLLDQNNILHNLSDYRGSRLVLYFFPKAETPG